MVLTRSKRRLLDLESASPEITDGTISADNFSPAKKAKMTSPPVGESSCNWHPSHEDIFLQFMEEEFDSGRMGLNNTLSQKQVNELSQQLKERTGRLYDAVQIIAKFSRMKARTNTFHKLINTTGFGWCSETNTVTAEENVWATYLKANPTASVFKKKGLYGYDKLSKIFKNSSATGVFGRASNQGPIDSDDELDDLGGGPTTFQMDDVYIHGSGGKKSGSSKRSRNSLDALLESMSETSRAKRAHYNRKATSAEEHSMIECMAVLKDMPVSAEKYARAADKLISGGKDWRSFFLLSNPNRQLEWVNGL